METHFEVVSPSLHEGGQGESRQNSLLQETLDSSGDTVNAAAAYLAELHSGDSRRAVRSRLNIAARWLGAADAFSCEWGRLRYVHVLGFMHALEDMDLSFSKWLIVALPAIAGVCMLVALAKRADTRSLLYGMAGCILCLFVSLDGVYQPAVLATKSDKRLAEQVNTYVGDGLMYSYTPPLIRFYCTNYYLNDRMRDFAPGLPGTGYVMLSERTKEDFLKKYSDEYQLEEVYLTSYRSCDLRSRVLIYKFSQK